MRTGATIWAAILGAVLAVCGTAIGCVLLATRQASVRAVAEAGGGLLVAIVVLVVGVAYFTG